MVKKAAPKKAERPLRPYLVQPPQQVVEHEVGIILIGRSSSKGAAKRRGDAGLVG